MDAWAQFTADVVGISETGWHIDAKRLYIERAAAALRRRLSIEQQAEATRAPGTICRTCGQRVES